MGEIKMNKQEKIRKKKTSYKVSFGFVIILLGIIFQSNKIGMDFMSPSWTLGSWLIYVGIVILFIVFIRSLKKQERKVDERTQYISMKASKVTFLFIILGSFFVMIIDGIKKITLPYSMFMSYLLCAIILVHFISYKILEKKY